MIPVATDDADRSAIGPSCEVPFKRRTVKPPAWQKDYYVHSGTSRYKFNSFRECVRKVNYLYAEVRFTCKWPNSFQPTQILSYKV